MIQVLIGLVHNMIDKLIRSDNGEMNQETIDNFLMSDSLMCPT